MNSMPLLSLVIFLPLIGALIILLFARGTQGTVSRNVKQTALTVSLITFALSLLALAGFDPAKEGFQLQENITWIAHYNIGYHVGVDGISLPFVLLTTALIPLCILVSWDSIKDRVKEFMVAFLVLETLVIGTFCALDFITFYLFFEGVLIPMFFIIGIWGSENRVYAAFKFFIYTLAGSVFMLIAIVAIYWQTGTTDIVEILKADLPVDLQYWLWLGFFASFAVKVPMWPFHTWLPDAHVQAPTAGSVILAGVLLKLGGYGFVRFSLPMFPEASAEFAPYVFLLSVIAIIYTSIVALAQKDMKKLIAYSSVAHMGYVTAGLFAMNAEGVQGAIFQMVSHGIISSGLFVGVGILYERVHTKEIAKYGGVAQVMPVFAFFYMVFMLGSVGLPGTSGFVGEFLSLLGLFAADAWYAVFAASGVVLGAVYMLYLYRNVFYGKLVKDNLMGIKDLDYKEVIVCGFLSIAIILLGVYPGLLLGLSEGSVGHVIAAIAGR